MLYCTGTTNNSLGIQMELMAVSYRIDAPIQACKVSRHGRIDITPCLNLAQSITSWLTYVTLPALPEKFVMSFDY